MLYEMSYVAEGSSREGPLARSEPLGDGQDAPELQGTPSAGEWPFFPDSSGVPPAEGIRGER
jgi:hypothetical protein